MMTINIPTVGWATVIPLALRIGGNRGNNDKAERVDALSNNEIHT